MNELELERVWRWTGEQLTGTQKLRRIQGEAVRINTLASVTLRSPEQAQRQGLVQLEIQLPLSPRINPTSSECDTRLPTTNKRSNDE